MAGDPYVRETQRRVQRDENKVWAFFIILIAVLLVWHAFTRGDDAPDRCESPTHTPCLADDATVRWIELDGSYAFVPLEQWRDDRASAAELRQEMAP